MKVFIPDYSGFCPGVKLAEKNLFELKQKMGDQAIYVMGQLIHNSLYTEYLSKQGIKTVPEKEKLQKGSTAVIRTHGIDKSLEEKLRKNLNLVDLTCIKVKHLQKIIQDYSDKGFFVVITGKSDHPEVVSLRSYAHEHCVIENEDGLNAFEEIFLDPEGPFQNRDELHILIVSQTTGNRSLFERTAEKIKEISLENVEIKVHDSICSITSIREKESIRLQKTADITFVVGDRTSANANKLFDILKTNRNETYFVENLKELLSINLPLSNFKSALVVSSSSTPDFIEQEVIAYLAGL